METSYAMTLKRKKPMRRMSKAKARETAKYRLLRNKFLKENPFCQFPEQHAEWATSIHHMHGQAGDMMNNTTFWLGVCHRHHAWIENNKKEARKMGLILYK